MNRTVVWFRRHLRVCDHAPLYRAARRGAVIPVFVFDQALLHHPETGAARVEFMVACLGSLDADLRQLGGRLILRSGDPVQVLPDLVKEADADGIYCYTDCERIYGRVRDERLNQTLAQQGLKIRWFEPAASYGELMPYAQYRQRWYQAMAEPMTPTPERVQVPPDTVGIDLPTLGQLGHRSDRKPLPAAGTAAARRLLQQFLGSKAETYYWQLSYPSAEATTGLSPHLKFGVISVRECVQTVNQASGSIKQRRSHRQLISRLRWGCGFTQRFRYLPQLELQSLYREFNQKDSWQFDEDLYRAWQQGQTGFPIVDAAARCLQATGGYLALNFRTRAIYASFLSNLLGMDWRYGALHFMRHLIDGDCPIDHYQWAMQAGVTHCLDKSWTRIYNPQQTAVDRCDPQGKFIKRWIPELAHLPADQLGAPPSTRGYPQPVVDYHQMRSQRVAQLEQQRQPLLYSANILEQLDSMPADITPFGANRYPCEIGWSQTPPAQLFPAALDLRSLDRSQGQILRSWFVAHVNVAPHRPRRQPVAPPDQLSLL